MYICSICVICVVHTYIYYSYISLDLVWLALDNASMCRRMEFGYWHFFMSLFTTYILREEKKGLIITCPF